MKVLVWVFFSRKKEEDEEKYKQVGNFYYYSYYSYSFHSSIMKRMTFYNQSSFLSL